MEARRAAVLAEEVQLRVVGKPKFTRVSVLSHPPAEATCAMEPSIPSVTVKVVPTTSKVPVRVGPP